MCIRLRGIRLQSLVVDQDDLVRTIAGKLRAEVFYLITEQNCGHFCSQIRSELLAFAEQLIRNASDFMIHLLDEYKYALIIL